MPQYVVTEDCYIPVGESTRFKHAGQVVSLDEADAEVLAGLVKPAGQDEIEAQVVVEPSASQNTTIAETDDDDDADAPPNEQDAPAPSDVKGDWVDFAVAQGESRDTAEAMTKAELIDKFG